MQGLRTEAEAASGVSWAAVEAAREAGLYDRIGGTKLMLLSENFYARVYVDEAWFRDLFSATPKEEAIQNQQDFFAQEFGGPPLYQLRKGHTAILGRHGPYNIDARAARRWLELMLAAIDDTNIGEDEGRTLLVHYFQHMAWYIVFGRKMLNNMRTVGYYSKHKEGHV